MSNIPDHWDLDEDDTEEVNGIEGVAAVLILFGAAMGALLLRLVAYLAGWWR